MNDIVNRRVIVAYWKNKPENPFEIFSSLKNFCLSYPEYNYNTLSNYISKAKLPFETNAIRVERKYILSQPKAQIRKIVPTVRKVALKQANDYEHDLNYWMGKLPIERLAAVTSLVNQSLKRGQRMDKNKIVKRKLKQ